ncbi:MAG TPA: hypothetical protein VJS38_06830 [Phenylobacterium sp.]|uniref:hypothetical protein n=1 Tax=Phenylobacterium sp. TaxID=1871053 RepID=UPI002B45DD2E|nr:hypothetical protein [Phenylobacterium sp.]HKR87873.1 hypothetical protein [Phenylobacterium sp.]
MTEDHCRRRAVRLMGVMVRTPNVADRRRLIDEAMRWNNNAMIAHDQELRGAQPRREKSVP